MKKIEFNRERSILMATHDAAYVGATEDPYEALLEGMVESLTTEVFFTVNGVKLHLAAWQNPDMWLEDWEEAGIEYPNEFIQDLSAK